jgi:hypothetical protein
MRKGIGVGIVVLLFLSMFVVSILAEGFWVALLIWGILAGIGGLVWLAVWLIIGD